jgi:alpha-tubulin suppressor-like RCC1 family protein
MGPRHFVIQRSCAVRNSHPAASSSLKTCSTSASAAGGARRRQGLVLRAWVLGVAIVAFMAAPTCAAAGLESRSAGDVLTADSAPVAASTSDVAFSYGSGSAQQILGLHHVIAVAAGAYHNLALVDGGTVYAWGNNEFGQLGDGTTTYRAAPVAVPGLTNVVAIAAGARHSVALEGDGTVWTWGENGYGQLGVGTNDSHLSPVQVTGVSNVTSISSTGYYVLAVESDKTVRAWGDNGHGQLGDGTINTALSPVVVSGLSNVTAVAASNYGTFGHSMALDGDGHLWTWGDNGFGQLGDGTNNDRLVPGEVTGLPAMTRIDAGGGHSLAVDDTGSVWAFGNNEHGQLGDGTTTNRSTPQVVPGLSGVADVSAGGDGRLGFSLAIGTDGHVKGWGWNNESEIGIGLPTNVVSPVAIAIPGLVSAASAGFETSLMEVDLGAQGELTALTPARILDTRDGTGGHVGKLGTHASFDVQITGRGGVPGSGVSAVVLNATVTGPTVASYLTVWPTGVSRPVISNLNYVPGQTVPNLVTVAVGADGRVSVYNNAGATHVIFDVVGYYADGSGPLGSRFHGLTPYRYFDTRNGTGGVGTSRLGPGAVLHFQVTGKGGVPGSGVTAVVMNVTVTQPTVASYLTVYPDDVSRPLASNLNYVPGQTVPNLVVVRVPASGVVDFYNNAGATHVLADVVGYYDGDKTTEAGRLITGTPARAVDTRISSPFPGGKMWPNSILALGSTDPIAPSIGAAIFNVTVTEPTAAGYITVFPDPPPPPLASNLNFVAGQTVPNLVMVRATPPNATVDFYNSAGYTHLVVDFFGYFTGDVPLPASIAATNRPLPELNIVNTR